MNAALESATRVKPTTQTAPPPLGFRRLVAFFRVRQ
jgi:hypothetical protein